MGQRAARLGCGNIVRCSPDKGEKLKLFAFCIWVLAPLYGQHAASGGSEFGWNERFAHYVQRTYSWQRMGMLAVDTGFDHLLREPKYWARGPNDFGFRYGSGFGKRVVRNSVELLAGAALDEDARFKPSGERDFGKRLKYAFKHAMLATDGHGKQRLAYSRFAGAAGGILLVSAWSPRPLTAPQFFEDFGFGLIGHLENSLLTEFSPDMKKTGMKLWHRILRR